MPLATNGLPVVVKFMLVGLWEKFAGQKTSPENTRTCTEKLYRIIYVYLPRNRVSQRLFDRKIVET